jgi:hypothetical protein
MSNKFKINLKKEEEVVQVVLVEKVKVVVEVEKVEKIQYYH